MPIDAAFPVVLDALLRDLAPLGPVRLVLRTAGGMAELFCRADALVLEDAWLHVRRPDGHLHLQRDALTGVSFHDAGPDCHPHRPSVWFLGPEGRPVLLLVLDQTCGHAWDLQAAAFRALQTRWSLHAPRLQPGAPAPAIH